jgi:hypothetical protein
VAPIRGWEVPGRNPASRLPGGEGKGGGEHKGDEGNLFACSVGAGSGRRVVTGGDSGGGDNGAGGAGKVVARAAG